MLLFLFFFTYIIKWLEEAEKEQEPVAVVALAVVEVDAV